MESWPVESGRLLVGAARAAFRTIRWVSEVCFYLQLRNSLVWTPVSWTSAAKAVLRGRSPPAGGTRRRNRMTEEDKEKWRKEVTDFLAGP